MIHRRHFLPLCLALVCAMPSLAQEPDYQKVRNKIASTHEPKDVAEATANRSEQRRRLAEQVRTSERLARSMARAVRSRDLGYWDLQRRWAGIEKKRQLAFEKDVTELVRLGRQMEAVLDLPMMDLAVFKKLRASSRDIDKKVDDVIEYVDLDLEILERPPADPFEYALDIQLVRLAVETTEMGRHIIPLIATSLIDVEDYVFLLNRLQTIRDLSRSIQVQSVHRQLAHLHESKP